MPLLLEPYDGLVEDDAFILSSKHLHQGLHEILLQALHQSHGCMLSAATDLNLLPGVVIGFERTEVVLQRHNIAVPLDQAFVASESQVRSRTKSNHWH